MLGSISVSGSSVLLFCALLFDNTVTFYNGMYLLQSFTYRIPFYNAFK